VNTGTYISGGGHVALFLGLLLGGWFGGEAPEPPDVADVSILTEEQFAALSAPQSQPDTVFDVPTPAVPDIEDAVSPPAPEQPPVAADAPEPTPPETPDPLPVVPDAPQPPDPELTEVVPDLPAPETPPNAPIEAPVDDTPQPQEAPRVAPIPVPESPPSPEIAETATPRVSPDANTPVQADEQPEAAPEEATTEIVTEAETPSSAAPRAAPRPTARPTRPQPAVAEPTNPAADAIADAVAAAVAAPDPTPTPAPAPTAPTGPPLTGGEKDGLRVAVQQCWNVGSLSSEALMVTVIVAVSMGRDGKPDGGSIRMLDYFDGSDSAARQAFEAARRAIIRCGANGYDLPVDKYEQWREIEMTFNPERMRIK